MGKLLANAPPPRGRANRKLREHHDDIVKLRAKGYLLKDIQAAIAEVVGMKVGTSTIQRELARARHEPVARTRKPSSTPKAGIQVPAAGQRSETRSVPRAPAPAADGADGHTPQQRADAFMAGLVTNPLLKTRKKS